VLLANPDLTPEDLGMDEDGEERDGGRTLRVAGL
jgi:hypothetical protein